MYEDTKILGAMALLIIFVFGGLGCLKWYGAGVQADIYKRQGIQITRWEIFVGAHPAEQVIDIKEKRRQ